MNDTLMRHLVAMIGGGGRLIYSPVGLNTRIADDLQLSGTVVDLTEVAAGTGVTFTLESQFPYTYDYDQTETVLTAGSPTADLINDGSIPFLPVAKIYGPFDDFVLQNADALDALGNPKQIVYDDTLPGAVAVGGGDYIEISFFHNTVYLNGSGANRKAGINIIESDFFPLVVGDNHLTITSGGTAPDTHILWQPAWF
jgi:phage-related protein